MVQTFGVDLGLGIEREREMGKEMTKVFVKSLLSKKSPTTLN